MAMQKKASVPAHETIVIPSPDWRRMILTVAGDSLIAERMKEKLIEGIEAKRRDEPQPKQPALTPQEQYEGSKYIVDGKDCAKVIWFKSAMAEAADSLCQGIHKKMVFMGIRVSGLKNKDFTPLKFARCEMRKDFARNKGIGHAPKYAYRPGYVDWSCDIALDFDAGIFSKEQVVHLLSLAGSHVGVAGWRPIKKGDHGMFVITKAALVESPLASHKRLNVLAESGESRKEKKAA
jgi:hypothetical protein